MKLTDTLSIKGRVTIMEWLAEVEPYVKKLLQQGHSLRSAIEWLYNQGARPLDIIQVDNLVLTVGKNTYIRDFMRGVSVTPFSHFAVGTGTNAPTLADTQLQTEVFRSTITGFVPDVSKLTIDFYLGSGQANGSTLTEAAVYGNGATSTPNSGTIYCRATHTAKVKDSSKAFTYSWDHLYSS